MLMSVLLDTFVLWEQSHLNRVLKEHLATNQCYLLNNNVLCALLDIFVVVLHL